jgi:cell division protein FtsL
MDQERLTGWAAFAGAALLVIGLLDVVYGLAALLNDNVITSAGNGQGVIIWDFTTWGWIHLILGVILILTAFGLFSAAGWARVVAIILCIFGAVAQVGLITAFPIWSFLMILLFIAVIYNLTAKGLTTTNP